MADGSDIEWHQPTAEEPTYSFDVAAARDCDTWPGICVRYGQRKRDGVWLVELMLLGDASRYSDPLPSEEVARLCATSLVRALQLLWPEAT